MTLLTPLGLLGLVGILILILIYIIKPNYQQKFVSSTFVWAYSLKYKKKKLPVSKLRNLLIILCQILILTSCAFILAKPAQVVDVQADRPEIIAVIDSSAGMRTKINEESRFERAVNGVLALSDKILAQGGLMSVIVADSNPSFLAQDISLDKKENLTAALKELLSGDTACSYAKSNIDGAITLCEDIFKVNSAAELYIYTDVTYSYVPQYMQVINVADSEEWNAAILNAQADVYDNYYMFTVEIACYGRNTDVGVKVDVYGANAKDKNDEGKTVSLNARISCSDDQTQKIVFVNGDADIANDKKEENVVYYPIASSDKIYSYQSVHVALNEKDSFQEDNTFDIYGGQKEVMKIQYASSLPNSFFNGVLLSLKTSFADRWDVQITEIKTGEKPALQGFDFYIFEHTMPKTMPTDGVVFLADPDSAPADAGFRPDGVFGFTNNSNVSLTKETDHPMLNYLSAKNIDKITISRYTYISAYDSAYQVLLSCTQKPMLLVKNQPKSKVVIMPFSMHYSNLSILPEFTVIMYNTFQYFLPAVVVGNSFDVNENISLNTRGEELTVSGGGSKQQFTSFPATLNPSLPGTYTLTQETFFGKTYKESIYVKIPASESNIFRQEDSLKSIYREQQAESFAKEWAIYFAAALVALLFAEWLLQSRTNA